jgi:transcriptional regulator GlxA family with amidase domain
MQRIGVLVFPNFQLITLAALPVFENANLTVEHPRYEVQLLSEHGGLVRSSIGVSVDTEAWADASFDTLIVGSTSIVSLLPTAPTILSFIRQSASKSRRIASICLSAFVLAEAGILDECRATTHWAFAQEFKLRFPRVAMDEDRIFVVDGNKWTSAGMTAGVDLALAMVEQDMGVDVARLVAKQLVVYHRRTGGQLQYSALLELQPRSDRIQKALAFVRENLKKPISVEQLAAVANLTSRHFSRAFQAETGLPPAKAIEKLRVEAARLMLEEGRHSMETIASDTGFADRERMRRAFVRALGQSPQRFRRNIRSDISAR